MYKEDPQTIEEVLAYLQHWIKRAGPDMPRTDPEHIIARLMTVCVLSDSADVLAEKYALFEEIAAQVSSIEIGDGDIYERWKELKTHVYELDKWLAAREK